MATNLNNLNKILYLFWRLAVSLIIAIIITIVFLQKDPWIKEKLENYINNTMSIMLKSNFSCKLSQIDLLYGKVKLTNIKAFEKKKWNLSIEEVYFNLSFRDLILNLEPNVIIYCKKAKLSTTIKEKKFAFIDAINNYLKYPTYMPFKLKFLAFNSSNFCLHDIALNKNLNLNFNGITNCYNSFIKLNISCISGNFNYYNQSYCENIAGSLSLDIPLDGSNYLDNLNLNISLDLPLYKSNKHSEAHCYLRGEYKKNQGIFRLNNSSQSIKFNCIFDKYKEQKKDIKFNGYFPLGLFKPLFSSKLNFIDSLGGYSIVQGHLNFKNFKDFNNTIGDFAISFNALDINKVKLGKWSLSAKLKNNILNFNLNSSSNILPISLNGCFDFDNKTNDIELKNYKKLKLYNYSIEPENLNAKIKLDEDFNLKILKSNTSALCIDKEIKLKIIAQQRESLLYLNAKLNDYLLKSSLDIFNKKIINLNISKKLENNLKDSLNIKNNTGQIDYSLVKEIIKNKFNNLSGQGKFNFKIKDKTDGSLILSLNLENGDICLPGFYNIIKNLSCNIILDFYKNILVVKDLSIDFYQGNIKALKSTFYFDSNYKLFYANIPLILKDFLINYKRQFLGLADGDINLVYNLKDSSVINGNLVLAKANFDGNAFSDSNIKSELIDIINPESNINLDLHIESKLPLSIKFGSLEASSKVNINMGGSLSNIKWSGQLDLLDGKVNFAYKPLFINYGKLLLNPDNISNSSINLAAKNRIKNYNISLFVNGSFNDLKLKLDSNPSLDQEKIIALLLGGNSQGALYTAMPQMLIGAFENYILGKNNTIKSIFKPLKNIRFIPINIDKNNNQDIGGAVEIDINDKLSALIETDLSFSENPRVEVDYAVSDNISIKGIRSPKGDLEAEIEMRLKF